MASKCRKFVPNIFNKSKCQNCFAAKDVHSAEALENNKASRKVSKCGYLFVAPDLDFSNPLDKTRRWQRRFFILYDDGEFTYSVDENPETIPQGEVDMNKCVDVYEAENLTGHQYSLAIATSSKVYYIKGNSKEEISRWFDVLVMYPRSIKTTKRRISPHFKSDIMQTTSENSRTNQDSLVFNSFGANKSLSFDKIDIDKLKSTPYATYRGVRSMKHKGDKHYNEGLRKSNSLHDLSSSGAEISRGNLLSSKFLSRSGDQLDYISLGEIFMHSSNGTKKDWNLDTTKTDSTKMENIVSFLGARSSTPSKLRTNINTLGHRSRRGSFDEKRATRNTQPKSSANRSSSLHRERSSDMMEFSPRLSFPNSDSNIDIDGPQSRKGPQKNDLHSNSREEMLYTSRNNETDELKMAKSSEQNAAAKQKEMKQERKIEDLMYMKKGWLIKQGSSERDWKKHWFVLDAKSLRYFKDAKAEEENILDGRIDLSTCYEIAEVNVPKNYGFCVKTRNGEFILTAMTSGIRNNWMKAIKLCIDMQKGILKKTLSSVNGETLIRNEKSSVDSSTRTRYASGKAFDSELRKKEVAKNIRRHHSDVNPGNVDKALKIREISSGSLETLDIVDGDVTQGLNQRIVGSRNSQTLFTNSLSSNDLSKKSDQWPHQNGHHSPLGRYVEGSDNTSSEQKLSSWNKDGKKHETIHRTKSPSARVKEKTRSKLPKLLSPPPNAGNGSGFGLQGRDQYQHDIGLGTSEQNTSQDHDQHFADVHGDLNSSSSISRNDGMLVDLLETEAWNLKCQLKDAQEIIRRHKMEVDNLKSKLDMLASKLTGTEKALSEALWDMKQEKELHAKMSTEWSKRTKAAEAQLKEITQKLDKSRASLQAKERECKKLENEVKINMQKIRDSEREILKLRAIEHEYKQTKELLDNNYREKDIMCKTMKEKDLRCRKLEEHIKEMKREFEHDIQSMKDRLCQVQSGMHGSLPSDVSSLLHEKEEIINQLEEKLIESDKKIEDVTDELQAEIGKGSSLQVQLDKAMKENSLLKSRFQDLEKTFNEIQRKLEIGEKENMVLKKQVQDHKEEENKLLTKLEIERGSNSDLLEENSDLQSTVNYLNEHLKQLNDNLNSHHADVDYLISESLQKEEKLYRKKLSELGSNLINSKLCVGKVNDLLQQIMEAQKQDYNQVLTLAITSAADLETCLSSAQHILSGLSPICTAVESDDSDTEKNADMHEIINAQELLDQAMLDTKKLHEELTDVRNNYDKLELDDQRVRKRVRQLEEDYNNQLRVMSQRIDKLTDKLETSERNLHEQKKPSDRDSNLTNVSAEIENQLEELENRIESVEKVLEVQDVDGSLIGRHSENGDLSDSSDDLTSTESSDDDLDSDYSDLEISGNLISLSNNAELISKLKDMKTQLECTNSKLRDFTQDLYRKPPSSQVASPDACLQIKLQRCGEKIENLASRLTKEVFSDNLLGLKGKNVDKIKLSFYACMNQLEEKLYEVNEEVRTIESVGTKLQVNKMIPKIKDKLSYMIRYVRQVESMTEDDWHILGQLYQQRMAIEVKLKQQNSDGCDSDNNTNVQLVLFAEKLALEVAVLGELSYLLQNNYLTNRCSDDLWKEINEVNQLFLQLREKLIKDLDESPLNDDAELLTFYVKMLTEKIIVEGHLISKLGIKKKLFTKEDQSTDSNTDLASLAAEVISRTLTHEYMDHQFLCLGDHLEKFSGHILTQSLLQGELTYALQTLKGKIKQQMESDQDFIKSETHNAYIKLKNQEQLCNELVKKYQSKKIQQIQEIVKESSGKQNVVLVVSQVYRLLETHIKQYEQLLDPSLPTFLKCQIIHSALRKEQDTFMKTIQTALQNTDGTETSAGKDFVDNLKSHLVELADVLVLNATISGQVAYISNLYKDTLHNPESQLENSESIQMMSLSDDDRKLESLTHKLGEILLDEANQKRHFAYQLIKDAQQSCSEGTDVEKIKDMLKCMQSSGKFPYRLTDFSNLVVREAVFRAEMCYLIKKINLELEEEITEFKANHSLDQSGGFQSQEGKRSTADVRDLLSICEDVIKTKYEDEREVLDALKKEVDCLGRLSLNKNCANCTGANLQIGKLEQAFRKELSVAQERHGVHLDVMRKELNSASGKISEFFDSQNKERDNLVGDYESRVGQLQDELDCIRDEREEELEQVKQDIMTAVSAIRTSEHQTECQLMEQVKQLSRQITTQKNAFDLILEEIKPVLLGDDKDYILKKIKDFQQTNQGTQFEVGDKFLDQTDSLLTDDSTDSNTILQEEISKEAQEDKENEKAEKTLEISQHEQELELLIKEKEEALEEEARSTKAALDAMRKAYEDNLDQEKNRFREALKTMYTSDYVNEIRRHHELEVDKLQEELKSLNLHYTSKCEDYKMMEERLENSKEEQKYHIKELVASNEQLSKLLNEEIEQLKELVTKRCPKGLPAGSTSLEEDLYEAQLMIRIKDSEIQKLKTQVKMGNANLQTITEDNKQVMTQFLHCKKLYTAVQEELTRLKSKLDKAIGETKIEQPGVQRRQPVRKAPSFHHRTRSPSPQRCYLSQKKDEHISREVYKGRRYLATRDIRRSKSSPSLPFVFGSKQLLGDKGLLGKDCTASSW